MCFLEQLVTRLKFSLFHVPIQQDFTSRLSYQEQKEQLAAQQSLAQQRIKQDQKEYLNIQLRKFRREQIIQRHMLEKTLQAEVSCQIKKKIADPFRNIPIVIPQLPLI